MSPTYVQPDQHVGHSGPLVRRLDDTRGTWAMALFISTEAMLFVCLFFAYYYVEKGNQRWMVEVPPHLHYAVPIFGVLVASAGTLFWGQKQLKKAKVKPAVWGLVATIVLALGSLALEWFDFTEQELHLTPDTDAYGSIFYTIDGLHVAHLVLGILMLFWLLALSRRWWRAAPYTPFQPYLNVALYWYFVVALWVVVLCILYIAPNIYRAV